MVVLHIAMQNSEHRQSTCKNRPSYFRATIASEKLLRPKKGKEEGKGR